MLTEAIVFSLIVGYIRGGRFAELARVPVRAVWIVLAAVFIRFATGYIYGSSYSWAEGIMPYNLYIQTGSYLLLLIFIFINRRLYGMKIAGLGIIMNMVVIAANKGYMPVWTKVLPKDKIDLLLSGKNAVHMALSGQTRLPFLADIIYIPPPYPLPQLISVGDILISLGVFLLIQKAMLQITHCSPYKLGHFNRQI